MLQVSVCCAVRFYGTEGELSVNFFMCTGARPQLAVKGISDS